MGKQAVRVVKVPVRVAGRIKADSIQKLYELGFLPIHTVAQPTGK